MFTALVVLPFDLIVKKIESGKKATTYLPWKPLSESVSPLLSSSNRSTPIAMYNVAGAGVSTSTCILASSLAPFGYYISKLHSAPFSNEAMLSTIV